MMMTLFSGRSPIGLDVGPRTVAAAQLAPARRMPGGWRLEAGTIIDRPKNTSLAINGDEAIRIAQILKRQGFRGHDVVLAVPDVRLVGGGAATLELPPRTSGAPLEQLARMEMSRAHRLEPSSFEMACWEVPGPVRAAEGTHMMAVACRHADAEDMIDGLEMGGQSGLRIAALDAHAWAIARACRSMLNDGEKIGAVLDLTESAALLAIVHDGAPSYERLLSDGALEHLRKAVRLRLGVDEALADHVCDQIRFDHPPEENASREATAVAADHFDNLASELRTALAYAEHRFDADIGRVLVQGTGAAIPGIEQRLSSLLNIPAVALRPGDVVALSEGVTVTESQGPALIAAIGLAMHKGVNP